MQEMETALEWQRKQSLSAIENRAAWFYAYLLPSPPPGKAEENMAVTASTILFPRERAMLPAPKGRREAAALKRGVLLKKDYLRAQLRDIVEAYADALRMRGEKAPPAIRQKLDGRLNRFVEETSRELSDKVQLCFLRGFTVQTTVAKLTAVFDEAAATINGYAAFCYRQAGWTRALSAREGAVFTFVADAGEKTCERCARLDGNSFTYGELVTQELFPPLHPHCRCTLIPSQDLTGERPAVGGNDSWLHVAVGNVAGISSDGLAMLQGFLQAQQERWDSGNIPDWLTLGAVSGLWDGMEGRTHAVLGDLSVYNIANWLTMGLVDLGKGAIDPDRPLSLEHWLNALGFASALYGMAATVKQATALRKSVPGRGEVGWDDPLSEGGGQTGTVWDSIKPTQPVIDGTKIPKSFELTVKGETYWIHPNATKHMAEYICRAPASHGMPVNSQSLLSSFKAAVESATAQGIYYDEIIRAGNWELIFSKPRGTGLLPVIKHTIYIPK